MIAALLPYTAALKIHMLPERLCRHLLMVWPIIPLHYMACARFEPRYAAK